ncbi:hypothetical protein FRC11_012793 [Ceratobasidium sp. 423]|nr:hypothetical protein FRC11_012793 [Ceratobasidium sp. 423]
MAPNNPSLFNSTPFQIYRPQGQSSAVRRRQQSSLRNRFTCLALDRDDAGFENSYNTSQLDAMSIASNAWTAVSASTIANCWHHTGLFVSPPTSDSDYSSEQEQSLLEEMAHHPNFMRPAFQRLWTLMGPNEQAQTEYEETAEEIARRIETGLTLDD